MALDIDFDSSSLTPKKDIGDRRLLCSSLFVKQRKFAAHRTLAHDQPLSSADAAQGCRAFEPRSQQGNTIWSGRIVQFGSTSLFSFKIIDDLGYSLAVGRTQPVEPFFPIR